MNVSKVTRCQPHEFFDFLPELVCRSYIGKSNKTGSFTRFIWWLLPMTVNSPTTPSPLAPQPLPETSGYRTFRSCWVIPSISGQLWPGESSPLGRVQSLPVLSSLWISLSSQLHMDTVHPLPYSRETQEMARGLWTRRTTAKGGEAPFAACQVKAWVSPGLSRPWACCPV